MVFRVAQVKQMLHRQRAKFFGTDYRRNKVNVLSLFDGLSCGQIALNRAGIKYDKYYASEIDKHAIKVTMANYPNTIQLGSVLDVKAADLPKIDLLIGGSPCFVSGTKIITSESLTPIEAVRVGDEVLTHKGLYRKVLRVGGKTSEIYELQSQSGTLTETTENHPYYVRKRSKVWNNENRSYEFRFNEPEFVRVKDLTKDHYLATPILKSTKNPMELTEDECFVIGLYIGDGHTRKDLRKSEGRDNHMYWQLIISVGEHKKDLFSEKVKLKHSLYSHTRSTYRAVFSSKRLVNYVEEQCGCSAHTKHFGKGILDLPTHLLKKVIEGYLFADGSFRGNVHRVTTVSRSLVESLTLAVAKTFRTTTCVEYTTRPKTTVIQGRVVNQSDTWTVSFRENHPKQARAWVLGDFIWNPIKKLIKTDKKKPVFNLEVEEDNSYVANNHVVHNCQGFSFAGKQLNFDDPRSKLFFEFVRLLKECKPKYFLLENVKMKKEYQDVITEHLGVEPILINSSLLSAQNRERLYWANFEIQQPTDKGINLIDILETDDLINPGAIRGRRLNKATIVGRSLNERGVRDDYNKDVPITQCLEVRATNTNKSNCLTTVEKDNVLTTMPIGRHRDAFKNKLPFRYYTLKEMCRLQTVPENYFNGVSESQAKKMLGNGWTVDVIAHIFKGIKNVEGGTR
jgi:site-specific DNA-cytosine methylase